MRGLDFLRDLPDSAIETLAADARSELYEAGEIVVRQGEKGDELFLCRAASWRAATRATAGRAARSRGSRAAACSASCRC